jgi:hypothetical protein
MRSSANEANRSAQNQKCGSFGAKNAQIAAFLLWMKAARRIYCGFLLVAGFAYGAGVVF